MDVDGYLGKRGGSTRCWGGVLHNDPECRYLPDSDEGQVKPVSADDFPHKEWCQRCARGAAIYNEEVGEA